MSEWFGASWETIGYVSAGTVAMYFSTVTAARIAGRRRLAQISAFDTIVTIAIGSLLATTAVSREASYAEGMAALLTLLGLQLGVAAMRRRFSRFRRIIEFRPELVVRTVPSGWTGAYSELSSPGVSSRAGSASMGHSTWATPWSWS
jgi:multisubunit Na+/H+ antiporter MnhF subunit